MLRLIVPHEEKRPLKVLCLGVHSDDIEIGCGGTVLKLIEGYGNMAIHWVVFSSNEQRRKEAENSAKVFLADPREKYITIKGFRDGFFPYNGGEIKEYFEALKREVDPDLVLTHYRLDLHQDYRVLFDLSWSTFRDHLILKYEIPKYDGDLGQPNVYVRLEESTVDRKGEELVIEPFKRLISNKQLMTLRYDGCWIAMDTFRDKQFLDEMVSSNGAPWEGWEKCDHGLVKRTC